NFLETIQKSDLTANLPSVFSNNTSERYPAFESFVKMIRFLTKKDPYKRPTYQDIEKMIKRLTTMEQDYCLQPDSPKSDYST
ncbi:MAG TPA: hypothetical protein PLD88_15640, partial [Candidatus Berkiella sp.]|nr:hypothetical protein [Candidatus Berkiella sp.]